MSPATHRRPRCLPALTGAVTLCLALASCTASQGSGSPSSPSTTAPAGQKTAQGLTLSGRWPLTGLPAKGRAPRHPVLVVKVDNSSSSTPQIGVGRADLVSEELVEGGETRLAVFYYQHIPKRVGPVRSMRASDIGIVKPAQALLIASGAAPPTVRRLKAAGIKTRVEGAAGFFRDNARPAPYNLFMSLRQQAKRAKATQIPSDYLPWGSAAGFGKGRQVRSFSAVFSGAHTTSWTYGKGGYTNLSGHMAAGDRFRPRNVLVLRVRVGNAGYLDPAGNPVPETKLVGSGQAMIFRGGQMVRASWHKKRLATPLNLRTASGKAMAMPPGRTWVELVPRNGGSVSLR